MSKAYIELKGSYIPGNGFKRRFRFVVPNVAENVHMLGTYETHTREGAIARLRGVFRDEKAEMPEIVDKVANLFA